MNKIQLEKNQLYDLYVVQKKTVAEICEITKVKSPITVRKYMDEFGIDRRDVNKENSLEYKLGLTENELKQKLEQLYLKELKSVNDIANILGVTSTIITRRLKRFGIATRSHKEANRISNSGEKSKRWNGGKTTHSEGYILVRSKEHPSADSRGYVYEHRLVLEKHLGRYLRKDEHVHHKNGVKNDNRLENLEILTNSEHSTLHIKEKHKNKYIYKDPDFNGWKVKEKNSGNTVLAKFKKYDHAQDFVKRYILNEE